MEPTIVMKAVTTPRTYTTLGQYDEAGDEMRGPVLCKPGGCGLSGTSNRSLGGVFGE